MSGEGGREREGNSSQSRTCRTVAMETKRRASSQGLSWAPPACTSQGDLENHPQLGSLVSVSKKFDYLFLPPSAAVPKTSLQASAWALTQAPRCTRSPPPGPAAAGAPGLVGSQKLLRREVRPWL